METNLASNLNFDELLKLSERPEKDRESVINEVAARLGKPAEWVKNVVDFESAGGQTQISNPNSSAKGLIQFTDDTAKRLGYGSSHELVTKNPSFESQMWNAVYPYLSKFDPKTEEDFYLSVFYPAAMGTDLDIEFPSNVREANPNINTPRDYVNKVLGSKIQTQKRDAPEIADDRFSELLKLSETPKTTDRPLTVQAPDVAPKDTNSYVANVSPNIQAMEPETTGVRSIPTEPKPLPESAPSRVLGATEYTTPEPVGLTNKGVPTRQPVPQNMAGATALGALESLPFTKKREGVDVDAIKKDFGKEKAIGEIGGTVLQAFAGAPVVLKSLKGINNPFLRSVTARAITSGGLTATKQDWKNNFTESFWNTVQAAGAGGISAIPELAQGLKIGAVAIPWQAVQLIGQPAVDLAYDATTDALRGKEVGTRDWWANEAVNIGMSLGFAMADVASGEEFRVTQKEMQKDAKGALEKAFNWAKNKEIKLETTPEGVSTLPGGEERIQNIIGAEKTKEAESRPKTTAIPIVPKQEDIEASVETGKLGAMDAGRIKGKKSLEQLQLEAEARGDAKPITNEPVAAEERPPEFVPDTKTENKPTKKLTPEEQLKERVKAGEKVTETDIDNLIESVKSETKEPKFSKKTGDLFGAEDTPEYKLEQQRRADEAKAKEDKGLSGTPLDKEVQAVDQADLFAKPVDKPAKKADIKGKETADELPSKIRGQADESATSVTRDYSGLTRETYGTAREELDKDFRNAEDAKKAGVARAKSRIEEVDPDHSREKILKDLKGRLSPNQWEALSTGATENKHGKPISYPDMSETFQKMADDFNQQKLEPGSVLAFTPPESVLKRVDNWTKDDVLDYIMETAGFKDIKEARSQSAGELEAAELEYEKVTDVLYRRMQELDSRAEELGIKPPQPKAESSEDFFGDMATAVENTIKSADQVIDEQLREAQAGSTTLFTGKGKSPQETSIPKDVNQTARNRIKAARGKKRDSLLTRSRNILDRIKKISTRQFAELDNATDAPAIEILRQYKSSPQKTELTVNGVLRGILTPLKGDEVELFESNVLLADLLRTVEKTPDLYDGRPELWYGYKNANEIKADFEKYKSAAESNPRVKEALKKRGALQKAIAKELVDNKLLPKSVLKDPESYFHRQVIEYLNAKETVAGISKPVGRKSKKSYQKKRVAGATKDFNTKYSEAEQEYLSDALQQLEDIKMIEKVDAEVGIAKKVDADYTKALEEQYKKIGGNIDELFDGEKVNNNRAHNNIIKNAINEIDDTALVKNGLTSNKRFIPEGYEEIPVGEMSVYRGRTVTESAINQVLSGEADFNEDMLKDVMVLGGKGKTLIVPSNVATTLRTLVKQRSNNVIAQTARKVMGAWKWSKLFAPTRAAKYMINNWFGDADAVFASYPGIFKEYKSSIKDLWAIKQGKGINKDMLDLVGRAVIGSGYASQEIPDISTGDFYGAMLGKKGTIDKLLKHPAKSYIDFVHNINNVREDALRLAAYRWVDKELGKGKDLHGASNPGALDALKESKTLTKKDRAAKISRELLGDYGARTEMGDFMRTYVAPFWSWMELNTQRYYRLITNAPGEGKSKAARAAKIAPGAIAKGAISVGGRVAQAAAFMMAVEAYNRLVANKVYPGAYDDMDEEERQMRIILHRDEEGNIYTLRAQGAFSDVMGWAGLENVSNDVEGLIKGETSFKDLGEQAANSAVNKFVGAIGPQYKLLAEVATKKSLYPDIFKPKNIRNVGEYVTKQLEVDGVYKWFSKIPSKGLTDDLLKAIVYKQSSGEQAYFKTFRIVDDYKEKNGESIFQGYSPTQKGNALYYFKKALYYNDKRAAKKWLEEYKKLGGTSEGFEKSVESSSPTRGLRGEIEDEFYRSLSEKDRNTVEKAMNWYETIYKSKAVLSREQEDVLDQEE